MLRLHCLPVLPACLTAAAAATPPPRIPGFPPPLPIASLILRNGVIATLDPLQPHVQAIAIRRGRTLALGSDAAIAHYRGPGTRVLDLHGAFATPGLIVGAGWQQSEWDHVPQPNVVALLAWAAGAQTPRAEVRWAPSLRLSSPAAAGAALLRPRPKLLRMLSFRGGRARRMTVDTCRQYLNARAKGYVAANDIEVGTVFGPYYSDCAALQFIARAAPATAGPPLRSIGNIGGWSLPPLICAGECNGNRARSWQAALKAGTPWAAWDPGLVTDQTRGLSVAMHDQVMGYAVGFVVELIPPPPSLREFGVQVCENALHGSLVDCSTFAVLEQRVHGLRLVHFGP